MAKELTNEDRAAIGLAAAEKVAEMTGLNIDVEMDSAITDTLANLMHLCRVQEIDFERCIRSAQMHFDAELAEASLEVAKKIAGKSTSIFDKNIDRKIEAVYMEAQTRMRS